MQLVIMVRKSSATQHEMRWTRVNELRVGRENTDTHRCERRRKRAGEGNHR